VKTGIVVVTWNSAEVIGACLDSCLRQEGVEIVVVDNASVDDTVEVARGRGVPVIANTENLGFAGGVNQGINFLKEYDEILLLNPDAILLTGVSELAEVAGLSGVGAAGGQLLGPDGASQKGFNVRAFPTAATLALEVLGVNRLLPGNPWNRRYRHSLSGGGRVTPVDQPAGAFLMVNRAAWAMIGGFDEGFWPVWFEDVDFCYRLKQNGFSILYVPGAVARHVGGHSASLLTWEDRQLFWYGSLLRFSARHFRRAGQCLVGMAVMAASMLRAVARLFSGFSPSSASVYSRVFRLAFALTLGRDVTGTSAGAGSPSREENRARQFPG